MYGVMICYYVVDTISTITMISIAAIDVALCSVHTILFVVVAISLLLRRLMKISHVERSYLISHTARTILMLAVIAIQVLVLLKDILSAVPRVSAYVASLLTVIGTSAGLVYSDAVGSTRPLAVAKLLLLYWFTCSALWLLRVVVCLLLQPQPTTDVNVCVLLNTLIWLIYISLLLLECVWIVSNVSVHCCYYISMLVLLRNCLICYVSVSYLYLLVTIVKCLK